MFAYATELCIPQERSRENAHAGVGFTTTIISYRKLSNKGKVILDQSCKSPWYVPITLACIGADS